jgi:hypothetical protein
MNATFRLLALSLGMVVTGSLCAQESPLAQLEFARKLRAKPGYASLAKEYFERLEKLNNPELAPILGLEQARTLLATARERNFNQRGAVLEEAKAKFEDYIKKNEGKPNAARAQVELARLLLVQGQTQLSKALREEEVEEQDKMARPAEELFLRAENEFDTAVKLLKDNKLEDEATQATFDKAYTMIERSRTYVKTFDDKINKARALLIRDAGKIFMTLEKEKTSQFGLLANAWLIKVYMEGQDTAKVRHYRLEVMGAEGEHAIPAQRLARFFKIQWIMKDPDLATKSALEKVQMVQSEAESWLNDYPSQRKSLEGEGVLFELASAYQLEAMMKIKEKEKDIKNADPKLIEKARNLYKEIADGDSDYAQQANMRYLRLEVARVVESKAELRTFDDFYIKANVELDKARAAASKLNVKDPVKREEFDKERKLHMSQLIRSLQHAITAADDSTPIGKVAEARFMLTSAYLVSGDLHRAAIAGEALARVQPPLKTSSQAAGYALQAYANIYAINPTTANRDKMQALADFILSPEVQKDWATDPVTGLAHFEMAMMHQRAERYKQAIEHLEKVPKSYKAYIYTQAQLAFIALKAKDKYAAEEKQAREEEKDDEAKKAAAEKAFYHGKAFAAIERVPAPGPDADGSTLLAYFHAKQKYPEFLYAQAVEETNIGLNNPAEAKVRFKNAQDKYAVMSKFLDEQTALFDKVGDQLTPENQDNIRTSLKTLRKYAVLGSADLEYRIGGEPGLDKVLTLTEPIIAELIKSAPAKGPIVRKDAGVVGEILSLGLRANVQKGKIKEAKQIYEVINRLQGEGLALFDSSNVNRALLGELQRQIKSYQQQGKELLLKKTKENFARFLEDIGKQILDNPSVKVEEIMFLANFYGSIEQHKKAAELYRKVPAPNFDDPKPTPELDKKIKDYWALQLEFAKALRLSKDPEEMKNAKKLLEDMIANKKAQFQFLAEFELNVLHEEMENYVSAIKGWGPFLSSISRSPKFKDSEFLKQKYFEGYYHHAICWYKVSQNEKVIAAKKDEQFIGNAVKFILDLEMSPNTEGWKIVGRRFDDFIKAHPKLESVYEKQKAERMKK